MSKKNTYILFKKFKTTNLDKYILNFVVAFMLYACDDPGKEKTVLSGDFPINFDLEMEYLNIESVEDSLCPVTVATSCPESFVYSNGYLIVTNNCHDKLMQIIRIDDNKSFNFINKGRGPEEFRKLTFSGHKQGDSLMFRDAPLASVWINPKRLLYNSTNAINKFTGPSEIKQNINVFQFSDKWVFNNISSNQGFLVFLNKKGEIIKSTEFAPSISYDFDKNMIGYIYYSNTKYNDTQKNFVSGLNYFPYLIITNYDGNYEKIIQTQKDYKEPIFSYGEMTPDFDTEFFYYKVEASDNYIYMFRHNMSLGDLANLYSGMNDVKIDTKPTIEVYDWQGNPICKVSIDKLCTFPSFDFDNGVLYGLSFCPIEGSYNFIKGQIPEDYLYCFTN